MQYCLLANKNQSFFVLVETSLRMLIHHSINIKAKLKQCAYEFKAHKAILIFYET